MRRLFDTAAGWHFGARVTALVCATVAMLLLVAPAQADSPELQARLQAVSASMGEEVQFTEERHSAVLAQPAVFEGRLTYDAETNVMSKQVESPVPVSMTVDERYVTVIRDDKTRRLKLGRRPELRALLEGFRGLITGDTRSLEQHFELTFTDSGDTWQLAMTPRNKRLAKHVQTMLVDGTPDRVTAVRTDMTNGDWQRMTLTEQAAGDR